MLGDSFPFFVGCHSLAKVGLIDNKSFSPDKTCFPLQTGHAQVSTTANIYSHVIAEADKQNADLLAGIFLKKA